MARKTTSDRVPMVAPRANAKEPNERPAANSSTIETTGVITGTPAAAANLSFEFKTARQVTLTALSGMTGVIATKSICVRRALSALNPDPSRRTMTPDPSAATIATADSRAVAAIRIIEYS